MPKTRDIEFATKLGERLRSARHLAGLSQEAMGAALNMTFQQIQKYEKGKSRLTVEQLDKWGPRLQHRDEKVTLMPLIDDVRASRDMAERSDDFAYSNGTIARIDAEILRLSKMEPGEQLLDAQTRQGNLTPEQQRAHLEIGMIVKIYDPAMENINPDSPRFYPWWTGKIVRIWNGGITIEHPNATVISAPFGKRIRVVGWTIARHRADLLAPLEAWERRI